MSYIDSAVETLERAESSLSSLIMDAVKAKAFSEAAAIASLAESLAAVGPRRKRVEASAKGETVTKEVGVGAAIDVPRTLEPSWMRPRS